MKKIIIWSLGASALLFSACGNNQATTTSDTASGTVKASNTRKSNKKADAETAVVLPDSVYRNHAVRTTEQMAEDLKLDQEAKAIAEEIFFHRAKRKAEAQQQFAKNEYRLNKEMVTIEEEADQQLLSILTHSQSKEYVQNREEYLEDDFDMNYSATDSSGGMSPDGDGQAQEMQTDPNMADKAKKSDAHPEKQK
ncbi:hypothetical protein BH24BAC1_BH24BAC1_33050 [soil metagenome]